MKRAGAHGPILVQKLLAKKTPAGAGALISLERKADSDAHLTRWSKSREIPQTRDSIG